MDDTQDDSTENSCSVGSEEGSDTEHQGSGLDYLLSTQCEQLEELIDAVKGILAVADHLQKGQVKSEPFTIQATPPWKLQGGRPYSRSSLLKSTGALQSENASQGVSSSRASKSAGASLTLTGSQLSSIGQSSKKRQLNKSK